jgi:Skp family chaperone for outer membrane proteins
MELSCFFALLIIFLLLIMAIDLTQLQQVIDNAQQADALKGEVKRALRKVSSLLQNLQSAVEETEALLSPDYTPAKKERKAQAPRAATVTDAEAPFGRKKDGTPKSKPGRTKL